jgi:hypothetical protein
VDLDLSLSVRREAALLDSSLGMPLGFSLRWDGYLTYLCWINRAELHYLLWILSHREYKSATLTGFVISFRWSRPTRVLGPRQRHFARHDGQVTSIMFILKFLCAPQTIAVVSSYVTSLSSLISGADCDFITGACYVRDTKRCGGRATDYSYTEAV